MGGGYTGEVRKIGYFIMSFFFFNGGGVDADCPGSLWFEMKRRYYQYQKI